MRKLIAIHEIQIGRDGHLRTVAPGTKFEFAPDEAEYLIEAGAAKALPDEPAEVETPKPTRSRKSTASE